MMKYIVLLLFCNTFLLSCYAQENNKIYKCDGNCRYYYDENLEKDIYTTIDQLPEYSDGGNDAFYSFIINHINLNKDEYIQQPRSKLRLLIDDNGHILSIQFEDSKTQKTKKEEEYSLLDKEIIQALELSEKWIPAKCNNLNVTTFLVFSFSVPRFR